MPLGPNTLNTLIVSAIAGGLTAYLAHRRGRKPLFWFFVGFFLGLICLPIFFFLLQPKKKSLTLTPAPLELQPYLFGPIDKFWYYLDFSQKQVGPMSHDGITNVWKEGKLSRESLIWHEELPEWKRLEDLLRTKA